MFKTLSDFNFGPSFIKWIETFYKNISSSVMNNGFTTGHFRVLKKFLQSLIVVTVKFKELWLTRKKLNWKSLPTT